MQRADVPLSARDRCETCHDPIIWTTTTKGKAMPVDADPHPAGNLELALEPWGLDMATIVVAKVVPGAPDTDDDRRDLHRSHFATCPDANHHRRPR